MKISVLLPCHNEELSIREGIESWLRQTRMPDQILVVNDGSTDRTAEILAEFGDKIQVIHRPKSKSNKSFAQEEGLKHITGDIFIATDGDSIVNERFVEVIEQAYLSDPETMAVCGYVKSAKHNWLTACREIEYVVGQNLNKVAQSFIRSIFVIPGCASAFRTEYFKNHITFDHDTLTEDLDFTYKLHRDYKKITYVRDAVTYTQDPAALGPYIKQMRRWYSGGWQNLKKHFRVGMRPNTALQLSLTYIEGLVFAFALYVLPFVNIRFFQYFFIPYFTFIMIFGTYAAIVRRRFDLFYYAPTYIVLVFINSYIFLEQFVKVILLRQNNLVWYIPTRWKMNTSEMK